MKVDFSNYVRLLLEKIPELLNSPGYDEDDDDNPYVANANFIAHAKENNDLYTQFLIVNGELFNNTGDKELKNLIGMEIIDDYAYSQDSLLKYKDYFNGEASIEFENFYSKYIEKR